MFVCTGKRPTDSRLRPVAIVIEKGVEDAVSFLEVELGGVGAKYSDRTLCFATGRMIYTTGSSEAYVVDYLQSFDIVWNFN